MDQDDKLKKLYENVSKEYDLPAYDEFRNDMQDETKRKKLYDAVSKDYDLPDYETFSSDMGVKKKAQTGVPFLPPGESATPSTENSKPVEKPAVVEAKKLAITTPSVMVGPPDPSNPYSVTVNNSPSRPSAPILPSDIDRMNVNKDADKVKVAMRIDEKATPFRDKKKSQELFNQFKIQGFSDEAIEKGMADADKAYIDKSQNDEIPLINKTEHAETKQRLVGQGAKEGKGEGADLDGAVEEAMQNKRDQFAVNRLSPDDRAIYGLNTEIDAIVQKPKQSPEDRIKLADLQQQAKDLKAQGSKMLYDPKTGQMVGAQNAPKEAVEYAQKVNQLAEQYRYKDKLLDLRNEAYSKIQYWDKLQEANNKMLSESVKGLLAHGGDPNMSDDANAVKESAENIKAKRDEALLNYDALNKAIMINQNPGTIREGGFQQFKDRFTHAISKEIPFFQGDDSSDLTTKDYYQGLQTILNSAKDDEMVPKEMKAEYQDSFAGELGSATGGIVGIMPKLIAAEIATDGAASFTMLPKAIAALKRSASVLDKTTAFLMESGIEAAKFDLAGIDVKSAPGFVLPGYLGKYRFSVNPTGKVGAIIAPFIASTLEKAMYGTAAMEAGGATESVGAALLTNHDVSTELEKRFGSGITDFTKKVIIDFAANTLVAIPGSLKSVASSPFSTPEALRKAANDLDNNSMDIYQEYTVKRNDNNGEMPKAEAKEYATRIYDNSRSADEMRKRADALEKSIFSKKVDNSYEDITGKGTPPPAEEAPPEPKPSTPPPPSSDPIPDEVTTDIKSGKPSVFGTYDDMKGKTVQEVSNAIDNVIGKHDEAILPLQEEIAALKKKPKTKENTALIAEKQAVVDKMQIDYEDQQFEHSQEIMRGIKAEADAKGIELSEDDVQNIHDDLVTSLFDDHGREAVWNENFDDVVSGLLKPYEKGQEIAHPESIDAWHTPVMAGKESSSKLQSRGLPKGKFFALDRPFASTVHDASTATKETLDLKGKKIYNPGGEAGFPKTDNIHQEMANYINSTKPKDIEQAMTDFLKSKGYDGYVRLIDGIEGDRELIMFDYPRVGTNTVQPAADKKEGEQVSQGENEVQIGDSVTYNGEATFHGINEIEKQNEQGSTSVPGDNPGEAKQEIGSTESIINAGEAAISQAETATTGTQVRQALSDIEAAIDAIDSKIGKLTQSYSTDGIPHERPNVVIGQKAKAEITKYAKEIARLTGWDFPKDKKGKAVMPYANIAPAGGEVTFRLAIPGTTLEMYVAVKYNPDMDDEYQFTDFFYRVENPSDKGSSQYVGSNKWLKENVTPKDLAKVLSKEAAKYEADYKEAEKPFFKEIDVTPVKPTKPANPKIPDAEEPKQKKEKTVIDEDEELRNLFDEFKKEGGFNTNIFVGATNPKLISVILKIMKRFVELGIHKLADIAKAIHDQFGEQFLRETWDYIKNAYTSAYNESTKEKRALMDKQDDVLDFDLEKFISDIKAEELKSAEESRKTPENFVAKIKEDIAAGIIHDKRSLEKLGNEYGLTDATKIKELAELAVVERGREIASQPKVPEREKFEQLVMLYDNQPNLTHRSSESIDKQQYSTPVPYAYAAGLWVGLDKGANGFESSAGNGMLTVAAPNPKQISVNEIDPTRLENLDKQGFGDVWNQDATQPFLYVGGYDASIANPPFGTLDKPVIKDGYEIKKLEHLIMINTLDAMKDDGKGAFIIGGHNEFDKEGRFTKDRVFFNWLYKHYNVKDIINVDGSLYKKQGTTFPTRLILIDGRKETPSGFPAIQTEDNNKKVTDFDELLNRVKQNQNSVSYENILQPGVDAGTEPSGTTRSRNEQSDNNGGGTETTPATKGGEAGTAIPKKSGESGTSRTGQIGKRPSNESDQSAGDSSGNSGKRPIPNGDGSTPGENTGEQLAGKATDATASKESTRGSDALNTLRESTNELLVNESGNIPYTPYSGGTALNTVVPASMAYHTLKTLQKIAQKNGDIDEWVTKQLGYADKKELFSKLSAEQIDAVAIAIHNIEKGQGAIIGDQTGIGKGRIAAAIIRYASRSGRTPIFLTEKPTLFSDLYRDLSAIGSDKLVPFIVNGDAAKSNITDASGKVVYRTLADAPKNSILNSGAVPSDYDYVVASYSQFNSEKRPLKRNFLENISNGAIFVLDESHNAGGDSNVGAYLQKVLANSHGVTFLSATFAKRPDNMPIYAIKTAMQEANTSEEGLVEAIKKGGVALQEIVSTALVEAGQMIRRERSFDGVEFNYKTLDANKDEHSKVADTITGVARDLIAFQKNFIEPLIDKLDKTEKENNSGANTTQGTNLAGVDNYPFASKTFNLIDQMLFAVKAEEVANEAIAALERGEKPVIAFRSTMGAFMEDLGIAPGDILHSTDFSATLLKGLDGVMKYTVKSQTGSRGEPKVISPSQLSKEGLDAYNKLREQIIEASSGISISPIDVIIDKIEKAGYTVGEVTGRKLRFKMQPDGSALVESKKEKDSKKIFRGFNNLNAEGKPDFDVLMFNQSGSTGVSAHSSVDFTDQRVRTMIIHQPHLDINTMVQTLGRVLRTGQVVNPKYIFMSTAISAEKRLMMMLKKKLKSLSANTTSSQKGSDDLLDQEDFLNHYGDEIVLEYLIEHPEINDMFMDPLKLKDKSEDEQAEMSAPENAAMKVTGRVAIMPTAIQETFYAEIMRRYKDYVDYLNQTDSNDLEVQSLPLEAQTIGSQVVVEGKGGDSPFGSDSVLEKAEVNILKKPYTKSQVEKMLTEQTDGTTPEKQQQQIHAEVIDAIDSKFEADKENAIKVNAEKRDRALSHATDEEDADGIRGNFERALEEKLRLMDYQHNNKRTFLNNMLKEFRPGKVVMVPVSEKNLMFGSTPGIVIGFTINKKIGNPYAPSAIKLKIAIGDSRQMINIPLSRNNMLNGIVSATYLNLPSQKLLDSWDTMQSKKSRGERYIVTGNILQAFGNPEFDGGKLIAYTTKDGDLKKGILLPEQFAQNVNTTNPVITRPIINMLPQILTLQYNQFVKTSNGEMTIKMEDGEYKIEVPRSKKQGGEVYLDSDIRDLVQNRNFNSYGQSMVAYVDKGNIESFIKTVQQKFSYSVNAINEKSIDQQIKDQKKNIDDAENDLGGGNVSMNPIPTRKQARLLYEYGKLAWLYLKKGMGSLADFLRVVGERFSEYAVKAWNEAKENFDKERIAKGLDNMKIKNKLFGIMPPFNLFPAIWNTTMDVTKKAILSGSRSKVEIEKAIDDALVYAKNELAAAGGPAMLPAEEKMFKARMRATMLRIGKTPSFALPNHPISDAEKKVAQEMFNQMLNPKDKPSTLPGKVKDFFLNLSKHIDNPFVYVTRLEDNVLKAYPNAQRMSRVPLGRVFEQSYTGPAKLAVEAFIDDVLKGLSNTELQSLHEYIAARRVIDRLKDEDNIKATGNVTIQQALAQLENIQDRLSPSQYQKIVDRGELFQKHADGIMLELYEGGLISQETLDLVMNSKDFYAPFSVVQNIFTNLTKKADGKPQSTVLHKIKGISSKPADFTLNDLNKLQDGVDHKIITQDEFYRGAQELLDGMYSSGTITEEQYTNESIKLADPGFAVNNIFDRMAEMIYKSRILGERNKTMQRVHKLREVDEDNHFFKEVDGFELRHDANGQPFMFPKNIDQIKSPEGFAPIQYKIDGKTKFVAVNEEAAKALRGINDFEMNGVMKLINLANKVARVGIITYSPSFLFANSVIDNFRSLTMSKYGAIAGKDIADKTINAVILLPQMIEALGSSLLANFTGKRTKQYEEWMKSKSFTRGAFDDIFNDPNHKITEKINMTTPQQVVSMLKYILTVVPRLGVSLEQMPKIYTYTRGMDVEGVDRVGFTKWAKETLLRLNALQGKSGDELVAALDEIAFDTLNRSASPNFSAAGNWAKYMSGLFQFFSARVKGEFSDWRTITNTEGGTLGIRKNAVASGLAMGMLKIGMYALLPMLYAAIKNMWNDDDEKSFDTVTNSDKNNNILFKTGSQFSYDGETYDDYVKFPLRGVPATANTMAVNYIDYLKKNNPEAFKNMAIQAFSNATPINLNLNYKEGDDLAQKAMKLGNAIAANTNPALKFGYEELRGINSYNGYPLTNEKIAKAYYSGNANIMPWEVKLKYGTQGAEDISKAIYNNTGVKVTSAFIDHLHSVMLGGVLNQLDSNALSKRIYRSEELYPIKK